MIKKVLYIVRKNCFDIFGGDTIQIEKTKYFLNKQYNILIDIISEDELNNIELDKYNIIHIWGIKSEKNIHELLLKAKLRNIVTITSSIYWNLEDTYFINVFYLYIINNNKFLQIIKNIFIFFISNIYYKIVPKYRIKQFVLPLSKQCKQARKKTISLSNIIIPNSTEEGQLLCKDINLDYDSVKNKFIPVPNAVDVEKINIKCEAKILPELSNFVIEAAGIEPLKNQLSVVRSLFKKPEIPIVFAGAIRDEKYFSHLKKLADKRGNVFFTGKIEENQLFDLYKRAKVHILPSFRESPGLVTIEALMNGCQIVVSEEKFCPIKYYKLDEYGFTCNPYDIKSIYNAILKAYNNPKKIELPKEYFEFYSYNNVAKMTYNIYEKALESLNGTRI